MMSARPASFTCVVSFDAPSPPADLRSLDTLGPPPWESAWWDEGAAAQLRTALGDAADGEGTQFVVGDAAVTVTPVAGADGDAVAAVLDGHDAAAGVTGGDTFGAVFENAFDAMVIADDEGGYVDANPAACELFGLDRESLLGRSIAEFAPPDFDFEAAWAEFAASDDERGTFPLVRADGERRVVEYAATRDVVPGYHLSVLRDVTERERRRESLEAHRDRLARLDRLNGVLRDVHSALVEAPTRAAIEQAVCEEFAACDAVPFAWVGVPVGDGPGLTPRAWSGGEQDYLDAATDRGEEVGPAERAARSGAVSLVDDTATDERMAARREEALERGFRSMVAIPLRHGEEAYGALVVYASETGFFGALDREVFAELGRTVAYAVTMRRRERAFLADRATQLTFDVESRHLLLGRLASRTGSSVTLERFAPQPDGTLLAVARLPDTDPSALETVVEEFVSVAEATVRPAADGGSVVELNVDEGSVVDLLASVGARLTDLSATPGRARVRICLPAAADAGEFADRFAEAYPGATLVSKTERTAAVPRDSGLADHLTERQHEVLQAAYEQGYFDTPRGRTGVEVARSLDVSQPTFHQHIRAAQRNLLTALFEADLL